MSRPSWQVYGWWGIVLPAFVIIGIALLGASLAGAGLLVRLPQRAAH